METNNLFKKVSESLKTFIRSESNAACLAKTYLATWFVCNVLYVILLAVVAYVVQDKSLVVSGFDFMDMTWWQRVLTLVPNLFLPIIATLVSGIREWDSTTTQTTTKVEPSLGEQD